jgi:hypothetical protein
MKNPRQLALLSITEKVIAFAWNQSNLRLQTAEEKILAKYRQMSRTLWLVTHLVNDRCWLMMNWTTIVFIPECQGRQLRQVDFQLSLYLLGKLQVNKY